MMLITLQIFIGFKCFAFQWVESEGAGVLVEV